MRADRLTCLAVAAMMDLERRQDEPADRFVERVVLAYARLSMRPTEDLIGKVYPHASAEVRQDIARAMRIMDQ